MTKIKSKGTVLKQEIAETLTAVSQVISLQFSGAESEVVETRELNPANAFIGKEPTGYSNGGALAGEGYYDPDLAGHQAMTDLLATPAKCDWQVTYADEGATTQDFTGGGIGFDVNIDPTDLLKFSFNIPIDGDPGFPT